MLSENNTQSECFFWKPIFVADLFSYLPPETHESFSNIKQRKQFSENSFVFEATEFPSSIYILIKGQAKLILNAEPKTEKAVRIIEPNEILGLTETIACLPHPAALKTITPCLFEVIRRRNLIHFLSHQSEISFRLVKLLGRHLQKSCFPSI